MLTSCHCPYADYGAGEGYMKLHGEEGTGAQARHRYFLCVHFVVTYYKIVEQRSQSSYGFVTVSNTGQMVWWTLLQ